MTNLGCRDFIVVDKQDGRYEATDFIYVCETDTHSTPCVRCIANYGTVNMYRNINEVIYALKAIELANKDT